MSIWKNGKLIAGGSQALPLLSFMWADHQLNDVSWLRADTFSWQNGSMYRAAYAHLVDDFNNISQTNVRRGVKNNVFYYRDAAKDVVGGAHPYAYTSFYETTCDTVYCDVESIGSVSEAYDGPTSAAMLLWSWGHGNTASVYKQIPLLETIGGTEIRYFVAGDGHKIVMANQESNVVAIYNATGVAWYFIIDTTNQRFKLPREKDDNKHHGKVIKTYKDGVRWARLYADGWVEQGGQTGNGTFLVTMADTNYSAIVSNFNQWAGNQSIGGAVNRTSVNNVTFSWGSASSSTLSWEVKGWSVYAANASSYYNGKKYLYFYVGQFTQTALENTAGLNAELFNGKADITSILPMVAPDYANAVTIQAGKTEQSYTCPSYGFVVVDLAGFNYGYCYLKINGVTMFNKTTNGSGSLMGATGQYMVSPGDVCVFKDGYANAEGFAGTCKFMFIPCKGVN